MSKNRERVWIFVRNRESNEKEKGKIKKVIVIGFLKGVLSFTNVQGSSAIVSSLTPLSVEKVYLFFEDSLKTNESAKLILGSLD